ncbi:MAG: GspE/PulE family protein, partial [Bacteroidota bacterium]
DIRVSTLPSKYGEKVVMRLLTRSDDILVLENLNFPQKEFEAYKEAISKPNGIILITGPTGSGKTTTLYATLNRLNTPDVNILTIEDPIEYNLPGINQVQLKEEIGLSFDRALRAFLRQDPNIIMVGEIRDVPTAQIAIRAALTGHLVFSTLHTNSSLDSLTRLRDMGIEPYLLASALRLVLAQRLVRLLCNECKTPSSEVLMPEFQTQYGIQQHFVPRGCPHCFYTGFRGRQAIFEALPMSAELKEFIRSDEGDFSSVLKTQGLSSLRDNLAELIQQGKTSLSEVALTEG